MKKLILIVSICLSMEFTLSVYGCGPDTAVNQVNIESGVLGRKNPSEMSAAEIVETLYLNVPDRTIAAAAKDEVMILTGEAPVKEFHGYIKICKLPLKTVFTAKLFLTGFFIELFPHSRYRSDFR